MHSAAKSSRESNAVDKLFPTPVVHIKKQAKIEVDGTAKPITVYIYIYIHIFTYVYIYIYICEYVYICAGIYIQTYISLYIYIYTYKAPLTSGRSRLTVGLLAA